MRKDREKKSNFQKKPFVYLRKKKLIILTNTFISENLQEDKRRSV